MDFHYEVNGQTFEFSIPGGGFVSLEHLVEVLGITGSDDGTEHVEEISDSSTEHEEVKAAGIGETDANEGADSDAGSDEPVDADSKTHAEAAPDLFRQCIELNSIPVSEETKKFVADVANVEFSSPELVWIGKTDTEVSVG